LRWKKAQLAREIFDRFDANRRLTDAVTMLDWTGREFEILPGQRVEIRWEDLPDALRRWQPPISFDHKQVYIRDCFDELFYGMSQLEHSLRTGLLDFADLEFPMSYTVGKIRQQWLWAAVAVFLNEYDYDLASAFIKRFPVRPAGG
jgi:hypothetical protein